MIVKNRTSSPQQINYADGSCTTLFAKDEIDIDKKSIRPEELTRMKKFFMFVENEQKKDIPIKYYNSRRTK